MKSDEYEMLLKRSSRFYETAAMQMNKGYYDLCVFSLEQSLQLYLKAILLKLGVDFPRTHSIRKLLELIYEVTKHNVIKGILIKYSVELGSLEDAYITSRYIYRDYSKEETERLKETVKVIINEVKQIFS